MQRPVNHLFDWDCVPGERGGNESLYLCNSFTRSTIHCGWIIYNLTISLFLSFFSEASWWVKPWQLGCCHDRYDSIIMWWSVIRSYHWCSIDHCVMWKDLLYIYIYSLHGPSWCLKSGPVPSLLWSHLHYAESRCCVNNWPLLLNQLKIRLFA